VPRGRRRVLAWAVATTLRRASSSREEGPQRGSHRRLGNRRARAGVHPGVSHPAVPGARLLLGSCACAAVAAAAAVAASARFTKVIIDPRQNPNGHKAKVIGRFSNDGVNDIGVISTGDGFYLYRGAEHWKRYRISDWANESEDAQAADVNGDGAMDIVIGGLLNGIAEDPATHRIAVALGEGRYDKAIAPDEVKAVLAGEVEKPRLKELAAAMKP